MAHDLECTTCGHREAAHECPPDESPGVCGCYASPDPEWEAAEWRHVRGEDRPTSPYYTDAVWMLTPFGLVDIGS